MATALRFRPPTPRAGDVARPRIQRILAGRFDRSLTSMVAGPGFGKTTALARAVEEHRLVGSGRDLWLTCTPDDTDAATLARAVVEVLDAPVDATEPHLVAAVMAASAPKHLCLILDDVHHVRPGTEGHRWLVDLLGRTPTNVHVLCAGRVSLGFDRPDAVTITESELRFTASEIGEYLDQHGSPPLDRRITDLAGWPALVDVAARQGAPVRYIDDAILTALEPAAARALDCLVAAGHGDAQLVEACVDASPADIDTLPLVDTVGVEYVPHGLWYELRARSASVGAMRLQVVEVLDDRNSIEHALDVALAAEVARLEHDAPAVAQERRADLIRRALSPDRDVDAAHIRRWAATARRAFPDDPDGLALRGMRARVDDPQGEECIEYLSLAAAGYVERDDARGEATVLSALTYPLHTRQDAAGLQTAYGRLIELAAQGIGEAEQQSRLGQSVIATALGDAAAARDHAQAVIDRAPPGAAHTAATWLLANALNGLGEPSVAVADQLYGAPGLLPGMCAAPFTARWKLGLIEEIDSMDRIPPTGDRDRYVMAVWESVLSIAIGDLAAGEQHLEVIRAAHPDGAPAGDSSNVITEVALDIERGDDDTARDRLRDLFAAHPIDGPLRMWVAMSAGVVYLYAPEQRDFLRAQTLGPLYARDLALASALAALHESGDIDPLRRSVLPERSGALLCAIGLRHTAEYLAAARQLEVAGVHDVVVSLVDTVGAPARRALARASASEVPEIATGAASILGEIPVPPAGSLEIRLLGTLSLGLDGADYLPDDWRRERVRALLAFVILHPTPTREAAIAELWPDADAEAGRRNLRSTLNRLQNVLEPERTGGHAAYHLRSHGQLLEFRAGARATIDVHQFVDDLRAAEELDSSGTPSLAIDRYLSAIGRYRGDLVPDSYDPWVLVQRDALRARYVVAGVRSADLLTALDRSEEAIDVLLPVLATEPYSEPAHRAVIAAQLAQGDVAAARRALTTADELLGEVGGAADPATEALRQRIDRRAPP
ncbi:MAG: BTAD domain-containing putative transcriptional regulator [Actinomycetota bacterium]